MKFPIALVQKDAFGSFVDSKRPQGHDAKPVIDRQKPGVKDSSGWGRGDTPAEDLSCICGKPL